MFMVGVPKGSRFDVNNEFFASRIESLQKDESVILFHPILYSFAPTHSPLRGASGVWHRLRR